ncbi:hypothetical protein Efla_003468 [Eimeria flavescens]
MLPRLPSLLTAVPRTTAGGWEPIVGSPSPSCPQSLQARRHFATRALPAKLLPVTLQVNLAMWGSISRLHSPPAQLPPPPSPERAATPNLFSQVPLLPSRGPLIRTETRAVRYGSGGGNRSLACACGSYERAQDLESLQIEQEERSKLARPLEELRTSQGDLGALRRRGMGDRIKLHRLEQELNEAKRIINALTLKGELRGGEQFHTPDPSPKSSASTPQQGKTSTVSHNGGRRDPLGLFTALPFAAALTARSARPSSYTPSLSTETFCQQWRGEGSGPAAGPRAEHGVRR